MNLSKDSAFPIEVLKFYQVYLLGERRTVIDEDGYINNFYEFSDSLKEHLQGRKNERND